MPIRAENKHRYPKDWPSISHRIRERSGQRCEECGVRNHALGGRDERGNWHDAWPLDCGGRMPAPGQWDWCGGRGVGRPLRLRIVRIVLTVAHLDHQPENCADGNLRALCQRCHNRYDAMHRRAGIRERHRAAMQTADMLA